MITARDITGLVLAGGRGTRMGGVDKGLQLFRGMPLAQTALTRMQPQVGSVLIVANRNADQYRAMGATVWPDAVPDYAGPLAGFLTGLAHCATPYLLTVPCDSPLFPLDLAQRLALALERDHADIAMAATTEQDRSGAMRVHTQPVFCLLRSTLQPSLTAFVQNGGRKIDSWTGLHATTIVAFDTPQDDPRAFANANTLAELQALEQSWQPHSNNEID